MNTFRSWLERLVLAVLGALIGGAVMVSLQVQFGNITIINGDQNKVQNGSQTQTIIQPTKPQEVEAKPQQPVSQPTPISTPVQEEPVAPPAPSQTSNVRRGRSPVQYESEEDCTCPDDAVEESQSPPEVHTYTPNTVYVTPQPVVVPNYSQSQSQIITNDGYSQSQVQTTSKGVYVQSDGVTVRTSTSGANSRTRVVINGRVVVDQ